MSAFGFAYAVCSTAGDIAVKQVSIPDFIRTEGAIIAVHFVNAFTVSNPKIQVGSYTPADIKLYGSALAPGKVRANTVVTMRYNAGVYNVIMIESRAGLSTAGAVDLALPSGLLWCEHNVGASRPEDMGLYFSWGNVIGHAGDAGYDFSEENYINSLGATLNGDIPVNDQFDMAHHNMGGQWRLPRRNEVLELYANTDFEMIEQDGKKGVRFTSRINGNSIFFPTTGYCSGTGRYNENSNGFFWCSSYGIDTTPYYNAYVYGFQYTGSYRFEPSLNFRYDGRPVRAVM